MRKHSRRRFIGQLFAASIGSTGLSRAASATIDQSNDGLAELCVIARQPGTLPNAVVDVWTGQIGTLDLSQLPEHFGRVFVWDDVRGDRALSQEIAGILLAIEQYFGIKPSLGSNASSHLGHSSGLSLSIDRLLHTLKPGYSHAIGRRIAVIDLSSCGLTRMRWLDIMPSLRRYYTHVIGVDSSLPDLCQLDATCEPPRGRSRLALDTMQAWDYWLLARDESISGRVELSAEERSFEFTRLIHDLCDCIASAPNDIKTAIGSLAKRQLATFGART
jgi:hypothetical protein